MMFYRHLRVGSPRHALCGRANYDTMIERTWVTCPECQRIILVAHPGVDPSTLFAHPIRVA